MSDTLLPCPTLADSRASRSGVRRMVMRGLGGIGGLRLLEVMPGEAQLVHGRMQGPDFEILGAPVRNTRALPCVDLPPLAVRATAATGVFFTTEAAQFPRDLAVDHGTATA